MLYEAKTILKTKQSEKSEAEGLKFKTYPGYRVSLSIKLKKKAGTKLIGRVLCVALGSIPGTGTEQQQQKYKPC